MAAVVPDYCTFQATALRLILFNFLCLSFMYYLYEKYKPITLQYYIADGVNWVPRLTLSDLRTKWAYERALQMELLSR